MIGVVDIGGTKIAVALVDDHGVLHLRREEPTLPERGFAGAIERIIAMFGEAKLDGIAIGSTGPIDRETGVFGQVDTLPGWKGESVKAALRETYAVPIVIENDADAAALGETAFGAGRGAARFVYVTISTGIGGGIVLDGQIYRGADGVHPEIGHHMIEASGLLCSCGGRGCWEVVASGSAMAASATSSGHLGESAASICRAAEAGEGWAKEIVARESFYLGVGLANVIAMYAPDVIALGGGVMKSAHLFLDRAREVVRTSATLVPAERTSIVLATLGADAALYGAARAFHLASSSSC
jgi:glucokinase